MLSNRYFDERKPWVLAKQRDFSKLATVLYNVCEALLKVAVMFSPIMPDSSKEVLYRLGFDSQPSKEIFDEWGTLRSPMKITHGKPLFEKKELVSEKKESEPKMENLIDLDEFKKIELRTARVLSAERVPKSDKLVKLILDVGELGQRQIVAGIAKYYEPETLVGKTIIIVANLKPAKLMGVESQGMLLAAKDGVNLRVLTVDGDIAPGATIS